MRFLRRFLVLTYWVALSVLLLAPDPAALLGFLKVPDLPRNGVGVHFAALLILSLLVCAAGWPRRPGWFLVVLLVVYGLLIESLQMLVPPRSVELLDYAENTAGVLAGAGLWWGLHRWFYRRPAVPPVTETPPAGQEAAVP